MADSTSRGSAAGRARTRLGTEERRQQLLRVGAELFAERPYDEVWIEEVAELAGVSRGLLYHYFPTKRHFFAAVVRHEGEKLLAMTEPDLTHPLGDQLTAGLDTCLRYAEEHPQGFRAFHRAAATGDREIRELHRQHLQEQERRIVRALQDGSGFRLAGDLSPAALRLAVHGWLAFVIAVQMDWLERRELTRAQVRDVCARTLLGAVTAAPDPESPR